jgi:hypothetical protein
VDADEREPRHPGRNPRVLLPEMADADHRDADRSSRAHRPERLT